MYHYLKIDEKEVPPLKRKVAAAAVDVARCELKLPPIEVRWFKPITDGDAQVERDRAEVRALFEELAALCAGRQIKAWRAAACFSDEEAIGGIAHPFGQALGGKKKGWSPAFISVNAETPASGLAAAVLHECKHLADFRDESITSVSIRTPGGLVDAEKRADDFAQKWAWRV
jgi:hypothetical protein